MLLRNRITGVYEGQLVTRGPSRSNSIKANFQAGLNSPNVSTTFGWNSEHQYMLTGLIDSGNPAFNDPKSLILFFRDMYLYDNTAGSAVDIQSTFPFSDFELRGLPEDELRPFREATDQLNLRRMMPRISWAYLTDGYFCGSLIFDPVRRQFLDTWIHDALQTTVNHSPLYNMDPEIQVNTSAYARRLLDSDNPYIQRYINLMPESFTRLLASGNMKLDPVATLYIPRETMTDRPYVSYLQRVLPMYLIEKAMFRGTLTEAHRRQRSMTHITAGDDVWTPTTQELIDLIGQFQTAEFDPLGGWVSTRNSVQANDLRPAGDFWKWTDMTDIMVAYKLRALGISEAFLSGDTSFAAADSAYNTFIESQSSYREFLTDKTFNQKIFPLVAATHDLFIDKKSKVTDPIDYLFNSSVKANLKMPTVYWHKTLETDRSQSMSEMLNMLDDHGIPVPMKMWITAAGMDPETLLRDMEDDKELKQKIERLSGDEPEDDEDSMEIGANLADYLKTGMRRVPLLSRDFGSGLSYETGKTGKKKHIVNQKAAKKKENDNIIKAALANEDPNHRAVVKARNIRKYGTGIIPGCMPIQYKKG